MAASIVLNPSLDIDATPAPSKGFVNLAGSLLKRVKQVGESLRHPSPETLAFIKSAAFVGLSIGAGIGAKAGALALFGAATGGTGLAAAVIGGAAVGLSKAAVKHLKERNQEGGSQFFSFSTLKTAGISAAISTATLGYSELYEHFAGETITHTLGNAFHKVADAVSDKLLDMMPFGQVHAETLDNIPRPMSVIPQAPIAPVHDIVQDNVPKPMSLTPVESAASPAPTVAAQPTANLSHSGVTTGPHPGIDNSTRERAMAWMHAHQPSPVTALPATPVTIDTVHAEAVKEQLQHDYAVKFGNAAPQAMTSQEMAEQLYPENPKAYLDSASDMAQDNLEAGRSQFSADYMAAKQAPVPMPAPATPHVAAKMPVSTASSQDLAAEAVAKAKMAVTQEDLTNNYTMERLRHSVKALTGLEAPADATAMDLAKQINPNHPDTIIHGIQQQAPQLKAENVAVSCTVEIPKERSSVNVIKTLCYKFKEHMGGNDIAIVSDSNTADPKQGLRLLYKKAISAVSGVVRASATNNFIGENISGPNGVVQEMTEARLGL